MLTQTKESTVAKFLINEAGVYDLNNVNEETSLQEVEMEILPPVDFSDKRKVEIYKGISEIDEKLNIISSRVEELNSEMDSLTNHVDGIDYTVAAASGIIAGIIDSVWVEEFSIDRANEWGNEKVDKFVVKIAQGQGYKGNDLEGAIRHLEEKFPIAADKATNNFGGGLQHHLRDFSHHPTPAGLFFSLLTQFTGNVYGTDVSGIFKVIPIDDTLLIGKNLPEKITFGVVNWFFHMVSDMAGSSSSVGKGNLGTGLPGPLVSFLKEISVLPIFHNMNEKGYKEFSVWISKLFNGTLLGKRDENGKLIEGVKFDLRTEIGVAHELGRQAIPVIVNESIVRGLYFARRLFTEIKESNVERVSDLKNINWKKTLPFKNRTMARMLTISTSTLMAFDIADAAICSGGFNAACILRINFVGVGRFAVAIGTDIGMGIKKNKKQRDRSAAMSEYISLANVKMYYRKADVLCAEADLYEQEANMYSAEKGIWQEVQYNTEIMEQLYRQINKTVQYHFQVLSQIDECVDGMVNALPSFDKRYPGLREQMLRRLK